LRERHSQYGFGVHLVDQAAPFAAPRVRPLAGPRTCFDPLNEGRQHPPCPHLRFDPRPFLVRRHRLAGLSGACSPLGHCRRAQSTAGGHCVSIFLHPFALPAFTRLHRYYECCDSCLAGVALRLLVPSCSPDRSPCFTQSTFRALRLQPRPAPMVALAPNPSAPWLPRLPAGSGLRLHRRLARRYGRIEFVILRMAHSPPVAPHPSHGDAVTFGYRPE
jgi:hypothetical protein